MAPEDLLSLFFNRLWYNAPGLRCIVRQTDHSMRHLWESAPGEFAGMENIYLAPATFNARKRNHASAAGASCFWLDIDAGAGKPYATVKDALEALKNFCDEVALPRPSLVQSGAGLHAYFFLTQFLPAPSWILVAKALKAACVRAGFHADPARTADIASLLRCPGTVNRKEGRPLYPVQVLKLLSPSTIENLSAPLKQYTYTIEAKPKKALDKLNEVLVATSSTPRTHNAELIASKCAQMSAFRSSLGCVPEPFWYAAIQLLRFTRQAPEVIHDWSSGDPRYTREATDAKIQQLDAQDIGPTLCETFSQVGTPGLCTDCPYARKIKTPLVIGVEEISPSSEVRAVTPFIPDGFLLTSDGGVGFRDRETGIIETVYPHPLYVSERIMRTGGEFYIKVHAGFPHDGDQTIQLPMSACKAPQTLIEELAARGVVGQTSMDGLLARYITESVRKLTRETQATCGYLAAGWNADMSSFALGDYLYTTTKGRITASYAEDIRGLHCAGMGDWGSVFRHYAAAPLAYQLAFLTSFAAPLFRFTGLGGMTVSLVSAESGVGKSTVQSAVAAVYGNPEQLQAQRTDTHLSLMRRLGMLNTLPVCVDEMTNIDGLDLSEFIYQVSQGREKTRLTQDATFRDGTSWSTLVLVSSNSMLTEKLMDYRVDGEAERMRLLELYAVAYSTKEELDSLNRFIRSDFGHVGHTWAAWIVANRDSVAHMVKSAMETINRNSKWASSHRYYAAFGAVTAVAAACINHVLSAGFKTDKFLRSYVELVNATVNGGGQPRVLMDGGVLPRMAEYALRVVVAALAPQAYVEKLSGSVIQPVNLKHDVQCRLVERTGVLYVEKTAMRRFIRKLGISHAWLSTLNTSSQNLLRGTEGPQILLDCYEVNALQWLAGPRDSVKIEKQDDARDHQNAR